MRSGCLAPYRTPHVPPLSSFTSSITKASIQSNIHNPMLQFTIQYFSSYAVDIFAYMLNTSLCATLLSNLVMYRDMLLSYCTGHLKYLCILLLVTYALGPFQLLDRSLDYLHILKESPLSV